MYEFDYLLLCNKICGKSHYNMQMKIIVDTQDDYEAWLKEQKLFKNSLVQN
jgi:cytochrome c oxidase subunit 2